MVTGDAIFFGVLIVLAVGSSVMTFYYKGLTWLSIVSSFVWFGNAYWLHWMRGNPAAAYSVQTLWIFEMLAIGMGLVMLWIPYYQRKANLLEDTDEEVETPRQRYMNRIQKRKEVWGEIGKLRKMNRYDDKEY